MKAASARAHARLVKRTQAAGDSRLHPLKVFRLSNSKRKRAGLLASHRKQARSVQVSTKLFRDLGSGRPPPLKLNLYLAIIETRPAFKSEGEAARNLTAGLFRQ